MHCSAASPSTPGWTTVNEAELAAVFHSHRPRLIRVAYAVVGSVAEAEDVVADCWQRLCEAHQLQPINDVLAWCTVVVARAALDVLRSARVRREAYVGPWLPEPLVCAPDPADHVTLDESVRFALLVAVQGAGRPGGAGQRGSPRHGAHHHPRRSGRSSAHPARRVTHPDGPCR